MSKKYPDNPIVGILAKAIKQDWVQKTSTSEQNKTLGDVNEVNELKYLLQVQEERIKELETKVDFLMEVCLQLSETSTKKDKKGKIKLPYPTTYISNQPIKINDDSDKEGQQSNVNKTHSEEDSE